MSDNDIASTTEPGASGFLSGKQGSLTSVLDGNDANSVRKVAPTLDAAHGAGHSPDAYDLTNPNLHHGTQSHKRSGLAPDEHVKSNSLHPAEGVAATSAVTDSFTLPAGDTGPTATAIADQSANEGQSSASMPPAISPLRPPVMR